jgi:peroxiredoxin
MRLASALLVAILCAGPGVAACAFGQEPQFESAPGWEWAVQPMTVEYQSWSSAGVMAMIVEDDAGDLVVVLGYRISSEPIPSRYRPVAFDREGQRYELSTGVSVGSGGMGMGRFRLDHATLSPDDVGFVGVEVLTFEGRREVSSQAAAIAASKGVDVLPFPEIGSPYSFSLTSVDGLRISDRDYRGKVLVIDCWATWCKPCMLKMPELKALYGSIGASEMAIVGISLDQTVSQAKAAADSLGLTWRHVHVPHDMEVRQLWYEVSTLGAIPRLFVVDQDGILRGDLRPSELGEFVRDLVAGGE